MFERLLFFPELATAERIEAAEKIEAEIAEARSGKVREIEPWRSRLARCLPRVQELLEIDSLLTANCGEDGEEEETVLVESFSADAEREERIRRYSLDAALDREIRFIDAVIRLA